MQVVTCIESKWVLAQNARHVRCPATKIVANNEEMLQTIRIVFKRHVLALDCPPCQPETIAIVERRASDSFRPESSIPLCLVGVAVPSAYRMACSICSGVNRLFLISLPPYGQFGLDPFGWQNASRPGGKFRDPGPRSFQQ